MTKNLLNSVQNLNAFYKVFRKILDLETNYPYFVETA